MKKIIFLIAFVLISKYSHSQIIVSIKDGKIIQNESPISFKSIIVKKDAVDTGKEFSADQFKDYCKDAQDFGDIICKMDCDAKTIVFSPKADIKNTVTYYLCSDKAIFSVNVDDCKALIQPPPAPSKIMDLDEFVKEDISEKGYNYVGGQTNIVIDGNGIVHIYLDGDGNPIFTDFPVSAKDNYDKFQFHIIAKKGIIYVIKSKGVFNPPPIADEIQSTSNTVTATGLDSSLKVYNSQIFGPYTTSFPFTIERNGSEILSKKIALLKTNRVSLGTSVIASWIQNAENIETFVKPNGETTLIADNPTTRAYLGLFLTFHLVPRNINIKPRNLYERVGVSVGTNLNDKSFSNFFLGLNVEITNGLFLNGGLHYGQVNYVVGYDNFDYGNDIFNGNLKTKKRWDLGGPYMSINIDAALFAKVFKNILGPSTTL